MLTGPKEFLGMLGASRLRPCIRTNLKKGIEPYLPVWFDGDKYRWFKKLDPVNGPHFSWSVYHVSETMVIWGCLALVPGRSSIWVTRIRLTFLEPEGAYLQALTLLRGVRFIAWCLRRPIFGRYREGLRNFWRFWACLGYSPVTGSTLKKALYHTHPFGGACNKYRWFNKLINIRTDLNSSRYTAFDPPQFLVNSLVNWR